jgi:hypothetical protein
VSVLIQLKQVLARAIPHPLKEHLHRRVSVLIQVKQVLARVMQMASKVDANHVKLDLCALKGILLGHVTGLGRRHALLPWLKARLPARGQVWQLQLLDGFMP